MQETARYMESSKENEQRFIVPPHVEALQPYKPGRPPTELAATLGIDKIVNLASNENSQGTPDCVLESIKEAFSDINRYPEPGGLTLRRALAERFHVKLENVAIGSGSESILSHAIRAFLHEDDEVLTSEGTFIGLYVLVNAKGAPLKTVPLKNYAFDLDAIAEAINSKTKLIYLCNPNNPTGTIFQREEFEAFMKKVPEQVLVILDEAYYEFACKNPSYPDSMTYRMDNVLTLRTYSKAFGMAGIRLGYALGHERIIDYINRIKLPFEPNILAQRAGLSTMKDKDFLVCTVEGNEKGREYLSSCLDELGLKWVESHANFILIELHDEARVQALNEGLLRKGVAIRPLTAFGLPTCMRITVGLQEENEIFVTALKELLKEGVI